LESSRPSREGSLGLFLMHKAIFLDRDGVINQDNGYTFKITDLIILDGVIEGLKAIEHLEYKIIIITNQSGIARGLFKANEFHEYMKKLIGILAENGILVCDYFYCPHHIDGVIKELAISCECRKPEPGMIMQAKKKYNLDLSRSILIGDKETDIMAGINANLCANILVDTHGQCKNSNATHVVKNLIAASEIIKGY
jgi:D-glycero-D-manno-heptose 1,7-bisphosphate phosphatase